jgi:mono/diheme cytochrome c family protein
MRFILVCLLSVPLLYAQSPDEKEDLPNPVAGQSEAIAAGKKLYLEGCSGCHGPTAEGGRGPNLAQGDQIRGATNRHLVSVITDGVKGSDMPPSGLTGDKVWPLIAYLRNLTAVAFDSTAAGDVQSGSALFFGSAGCANCHTIRGRGGFPGPDLSNIGRVRSLPPTARIAARSRCPNRGRVRRGHRHNEVRADDLQAWPATTPITRSRFSTRAGRSSSPSESGSARVWSCAKVR